MKVRQYEVAKKLGISPMTVSRVLRGHSNVSDAMRTQILDAIQDLGGKHLLHKNDKSNQIPLRAIANTSILMPVFGTMEQFQSSYTTQNLLKGLKARLQSYQCTLALKPFQNQDDLLAYLKSETFSSVILRQYYSEKWIEAIRPYCLPVYANAPHHYYSVDSISHNESSAAWIATQHLLSLGHHQIAWFGVIDQHLKNPIPVEHDFIDILTQQMKNHAMRYSSWLQICNINHHDLKSTITLVERDHDTEDLATVIERGIKQILKLTPRPTALVVASEFMAYEVIKQLQVKGISIPQEMSLISYGNPPFADQMEPALTCIDLDHFGMGKFIPDLVERRRLNPSASVLSVLHECHLVIRKTTGPALTLKSGKEKLKATK